MKRILVVGYPKSGNTWMARLIGELLQCPVKGFWGQPDNPDVAIEGLDRDSEYQVFKGHHIFEQIKGDFDVKNIIYIVRDIRDIVISASHYYELLPYDNWRRTLNRLPKVGRIFDKHIFQIQKRKVQRIIDAVDRGSKDVPWCYRPWDEHIYSYLNNSNILIVRFEDLLRQPQIESEKILNHLGLVSLTREQISDAIVKQSFDYVKTKFLNSGDKRRAQFLRSGHSGNWEDQLSKQQKSFLSNRFGEELRILRYA